MSLLITAARSIEDSYALSSQKSSESYFVIERGKMGMFFYDYREFLNNYDVYYKFSPYDSTYLEGSDVDKIASFARAVLAFIDGEGFDENYIIKKYNISRKKIRIFAEKLLAISLFAQKNNYGLVGQGD